MKNLVEPIKDKKLVEEVEKYLAKQSLRNQLIWVFGCNTGLRISDILGLNVEDVEGKSYVEVREKKTGKYKRFPLNNKLQKLIKKYLVERAKTYSVTGDNPLFVGKKHHRLDRSQVYRIINAACNEVGITVNVGCHSMRKNFGLYFYKQYNNIALLQKIFQHSAPAITLRYIGITQQEIDESYLNFEL
ncbi:MAG: site-specific integrase [Bacteroidales bacterium]|nr:site-specific integrase [Bacteroidales bacterium]